MRVSLLSGIALAIVAELARRVRWDMTAYADWFCTTQLGSHPGTLQGRGEAYQGTIRRSFHYGVYSFSRFTACLVAVYALRNGFPWSAVHVAGLAINLVAMVATAGEFFAIMGSSDGQMRPFLIAYHKHRTHPRYGKIVRGAEFFATLAFLCYAPAAAAFLVFAPMAT